MFHSSTTLWQNPSASPLKAAQNRLVFMAGGSAAEKVSEFYGRMGSFGRGAVDIMKAITAPIRTPLNIIMFPVTAPTMIGWWTLKKGYEWIYKPIVKGSSIVAGTAMEAGLGVRDAIWDPTWSIVKAPLRNVRMNLLDLPIHLLKSTFSLPGKIIRTPGLILGEIKKTIKEFPSKVSGLVGKTRDNVVSVLKNLGEFKPIETTKSLARTVRDSIKGVFVDPVVGTFQHAWAPIGPALDGPIGAGKIIVGSKWQYATSMWTAAKQFRDGTKRIINAPGKELNAQGIKAWWKEVNPEDEKPAKTPTEAPKSEPKPTKKKSPKKEGGTKDEFPKDEMEE